MAMAMAMADPLTLWNKLKSLCTCGDGWSYAVFWRFHPRNSLLLTVENAYYEEQLGQEIANMLPQAQLLGEGIVGQAACTGKHRWVHSDGQPKEWNLTGLDICEDDSGLHQQFSIGIKTIVAIPVKPWGVVQFGSKKKILERVEFLEQTQRLLMESMLNASTNTVSSLDCENYDRNGLLASISSESSYDWNLRSVHGDSSKELLRETFSSASLDDSLSSIYKMLEEEITPFHGDSSYLDNQLTAAIEAQIVSSDTDSSNVFWEPNPNSSLNSLTAINPSFRTWSGKLSSLDSSGQQFISEITAQHVADVPCSKLTVQDSELTSLYSANRLRGPSGTLQDQVGNSLDNQHSAQSSIVTEVNFPANLSTLHGLFENLKPVDTAEEIHKFFSMDDICQWLAPSPEDSICETVTGLDNNVFQSKELNPHSFGLVGSNTFGDIQVTCPAAHNSITATVNLDGKETSVAMHSSENSLLDSIGHDLSCDRADEWWRSLLTPVVSATTDSGFSECISELNNSTLTGTGMGLFSELGIEELLNGEANSNSLNSSNFEDQLSTNKRKRTEYSPVNRNPIQFASLAWPGIRENLLQPVSDLDKTNNLVHMKETLPKLQEGLWIDDSHSINTRRAVPEHPQKPVEPTNATRKRAKPGESTRPRPKDRQLIQDRIKELRGMIPDGGKCSIDSLLHRTIRYMLFLQSITKHAHKLKEPNKPKLIDEANGVALKDSSIVDNKNGGSGVTWAFEVAGQTTVCPIIVEDMGPPGQMLIEMLCEEQGFFLEIVDLIRGFELNILKGKMEIKENKIWARFIVEANRHVTRIEVLWSLIQLLQQTYTSGIDSTNKHCNVNDAGISSLDNYEKPDMAMTQTLG